MFQAPKSFTMSPDFNFGVNASREDLSGFWVEIGQCAHDHGGQFELRRELALSQRRFPRMPQVKIEWADSGEHGSHVRIRLGAPVGV